VTAESVFAVSDIRILGAIESTRGVRCDLANADSVNCGVFHVLAVSWGYCGLACVQRYRRIALLASSWFRIRESILRQVGLPAAIFMR
jgi:hypothetical protein